MRRMSRKLRQATTSATSKVGIFFRGISLGSIVARPYELDFSVHQMTQLLRQRRKERSFGTPRS